MHIPPIKPNILLSLIKLFEDKSWDLATTSQLNLSLFDKFCERLKLFTPTQQESIIELTNRFIRIGLKDYLNYLYNAFDSIGLEFYDKYEQIFVYPLVDPFIRSNTQSNIMQASKTKSGNFLHYMMESDDWTKISEKLVFNNSISKLKKNFKNSTCALILLDDFVGTGNTAIDICKIFFSETYKNGSLSPSNVKIVSIAAQKQGIDKIKAAIGVDVHTFIDVPKGITDRYTDEIFDAKWNEMIEIEKILDIDAELCFGYGRSEALISLLNKTPNNTFPLYWYETKSRVAPFPRYKNFKKNG